MLTEQLTNSIKSSTNLNYSNNFENSTDLYSTNNL